ncbi:MAG: hypothetical protein IKA64_02920 [Clostridia bacterium]|nr:hypothetical protein [Clostridia bacterium]
MDKKIVSIRESDGNIVKLELYDELPSTVALAREYARAGYPDRYAVFASRQNKSPLTGAKAGEEGTEDGMFLSLILRPSFFPSQAATLGAMTAVSLISALEEHTEARLGLGWVSDLYCEGEKIGSAVTEGKLDSFTTYEYIIITFAVRLNGEDFPPRLTDMIKKVFESENTSISMIIARNVLSKFFRYYPTIKSSAKFMDIYKNKFILRGKRIKYESGQRRESCKVLGVDAASGALIVEVAGGGVRHITSPTTVTIPKKIKLKRQRRGAEN